MGRSLTVAALRKLPLVPEVVLQRPRVVPVVGELEAAGMAKHVGVDREWHLGGLADALDEAMEADGAGPGHVGVGPNGGEISARLIPVSAKKV
jgi:hypothetical protein